MKHYFIRFCGLSSVNQKGYATIPATYHSPPCRRGVYAFPEKAIEKFLLGSSEFKPHRMIKEVNENGEEIKKHAKPRKFYYSGLIWHHLGEYCKRKDILNEHGSWVCTSIETWFKAFGKELGNFYVAKVTSGCRYTKDHLEVFIEKV